MQIAPEQEYPYFRYFKNHTWAIRETVFICFWSDNSKSISTNKEPSLNEYFKTVKYVLVVEV